MRWRVFYYRPHRGADDGDTADYKGDVRPMEERRDQAVIESDDVPTVEQVAESTGDRVLRLDGADVIEEEATA